MPEAIGGYFQLESRSGQHPYPQAQPYNSARSAFRALVQVRGLRRVYLPHYLCAVLEHALQGLDIDVCHYALTADLTLACAPEVGAYEALLYVDYFGLKADYARQVLAPLYGPRLIVDNSQALFSKALPGTATLYSPRKFVGVADGGWLVNGPVGMPTPPPSTSRERFSALLGRLEQPAACHYADYQANEAALSAQGVRGMSASTLQVLDSIDYPHVAQRRRSNLALLRERLDVYNGFGAWPDVLPAALCYPLLLASRQQANSLRQHLLEKAIYVPCYWRELIDNPTTPALERNLAECLLPLPMDQRYDAHHMHYLADTVTLHLRTP